MRKRSDASKAPATPRSTTRNSAAARRGEERSVAAGKEQNKTPSTVSKAAEEKASEPVREIVSPRRSSSKKESTVPAETFKSRITASLSKHATLPETLQTKPEEESIKGPEKQADLPELSLEGAEKQDSAVEISSEGTYTQTPTLIESRAQQVSSTETIKERFEKQAPETSSTEQSKANLDLEALQAAPLLDIPDAEKPGDSKTGQDDVSKAANPNVLETGKPGESKGQYDVSRAGQPNVSEAGKPGKPEAGLSDVSEAGKLDIWGTGKRDLSEAGEPDVLETGKPNIKEAENEVQGASLLQTSTVGTEFCFRDLAPTPESGGLSNKTVLTSMGQIEAAAKEHESAWQEHESAPKTSHSIKEEPLSIGGDGGGGGEKTVPSKKLIISSADLQIKVVEAKHIEHTAAVELLSPQTEEHAPHFMESTETALAPVSTQQAQIAQVSDTAAIKAELTDSFHGEAAPSLVGRVGESSYTSPAVEVYRTTEKASNSLIEASLSHVDNSFNNNMVSSVEGETVLIVENLGLSSQIPMKLEETLSGTMGGPTEVDGQHKEDIKVNTESVLEAGKHLVGRKVRKRFGRKYFEGEVMEYEPELNWYKVVYEDGDEEELDLKEVQRLLAEVEDEDELSDKEPHLQASGTSNSLKRNVSRERRSRSPEASDDVMEEETQLQERVQLRGLRKRHVIDTSNDGKEDSLDSGDQSSSTSEESSEDDDDDDEPVVGKRHSSNKRKRKPRDKRRRKTEDKSEDDKGFTTTQSRLISRLKEESLAKSQETSTETRIATRRSTGALNAHFTSSDDHSLSSHKKAHTDSQDKSSSEAHSPLGGGAKLIGRKTKKDFGGEFYFGEIVHYDNRVKYYKVRYEDGDEEELEWSELAPTLLPPEGDQHSLRIETSLEATNKTSQARVKDHTKRASTVKGKEEAMVLYDGGDKNGGLTSSTRNRRKKVRTASVSVMMKGTDNAASTSTATASEPPPRALAAVRFASASDADVFEYFGWGEAVSFDRSKCPELRATRLLPTSSPVVHVAASRHHLVALTAAGQVWAWRCKHGNIHTRCNEWEHVALLDNRKVILVDISGPDVDRASAGYQPDQEDQVPDPFYVAAVCSNGEDIILQGSQPHESVHTYQYNGEPQHPGLREVVLQCNPSWIENMGRIVQVSVGMVEAADESPFTGYITDTDCVFIRSATRDFMEEVNLVTGYTGKPVKIQCGRVYHAVLLTDDGRAWTWGQGYYPGSNTHSAGFASKWASPFSVCQPAVGTLVGRKVVDVGCYGEDFIALTNDGDVHQWTHALPNPAAGVYNVPATPVYGQGPSIGSGDKLKQVTIGAGICAGISESGKVHTWRTSLKGGFVGTVGPEREAMTPLGRDEGTETAILTLGTRFATKVMCVAGSLLVVVKRKSRRRGGKRKLDGSELKGKSPEDEAIGEG